MRNKNERGYALKLRHILFYFKVELEGVVIDVVASLAKNPHEGEAPLA